MVPIPLRPQQHYGVFGVRNSFVSPSILNNWQSLYLRVFFRICWPFQADQPAAAAYLSERLSVAFELIEVRTGEKGTKPLLRNGRAPKGTRAAVGAEIRSVIDDCRGTKGEELRKNAEAFKPKFAEAWKKDGISRKEAQTLLIKYKT